MNTGVHQRKNVENQSTAWSYAENLPGSVSSRHPDISMKGSVYLAICLQEMHIETKRAS